MSNNPASASSGIHQDESEFDRVRVERLCSEFAKRHHLDRKDRLVIEVGRRAKLVLRNIRRGNSAKASRRASNMELFENPNVIKFPPAAGAHGEAKS